MENNKHKKCNTSGVLDASPRHSKNSVGELFPDLAMKNTPKFDLKNRRYVGCKARIAEWIFWKIRNETHDAHSFLDLFAGTGVISQKALENYDEVMVNDLMYCNNVIYQAFLANGEWNERLIDDFISEMNSIDGASIDDNYFSLNYGNKYFGMEAARLIGYARDEIEKRRPGLTEKEYHVLLASLIYSADRIANTTGQFEAYRKNTKEYKAFEMRPVMAKCYQTVSIYKEDANELARKVKSDIVYLDPPYNSRQYCSLYHVLENLAKWDKPLLYKDTAKPLTLGNKSQYCTRNALAAFRDLVTAIDARYIVVSYSNTYNAKSMTSNNKMTLEQIRQTMELRGSTKMFTKDYNAYNAGKTDIDNHNEVLFITEVKR